MEESNLLMMFCFRFVSIDEIPRSIFGTSRQEKNRGEENVLVQVIEKMA